jgi:hypothetical protein
MSRGKSSWPVSVHHRGGWCATKRKRTPSAYENITNARTICGCSVVLPWGFARREPDCPDCKKKLEEKSHG